MNATTILTRLKQHGIQDGETVGVVSSYGKGAELETKTDSRELIVVANTGDIDLDNEVVVPSGADTRYFERNRMIFADHQYDLSQVAGRLAVLFRGLGGSPGVELRPVSPEVSRHRLSWRRKLATEVELMPRASFDGEVLRLPDRLAVFPAREANGALYVWLAAAAAHATAGAHTAKDKDPYTDNDQYWEHP